MRTKEEIKAYQKAYYEANKEKLKASSKEYKLNNGKPLDKEKRKLIYQTNKDKVKAYYEANKTKIAEQKKAYYEANKDTLKASAKEYDKTYRQINKDKKNEYLKAYQKANKHKTNARRKERMENDPLYKLTHNLRGLVYSALKDNGFKKLTKTEIILGCSFNEFKQHIENQFEDWMNWDNYGNPKDGLFEPNKTWDIDHIIPTSSALTEQELIRLNHHSNLKPLCSYYNRFVKRDNVE